MQLKSLTLLFAKFLTLSDHSRPCESLVRKWRKMTHLFIINVVNDSRNDNRIIHLNVVSPRVTQKLIPGAARIIRHIPPAFFYTNHINRRLPSLTNSPPSVVISDCSV
jgi:hypothetical protein